MWLSEALILGRTMRPKCIGQLFSANGGSCAMGGVLEALGYKLDASRPYIMESVIAGSPDVDKNFDQRSTIYAIEFMNDHEGWEAQDLAEWLKRTGRDFEIHGRFVDNVWCADAVRQVAQEESDVALASA